VRGEEVAARGRSGAVGKCPGGWSARASRRGNIWARDSAIVLAREKNLSPRRFGASAGGAREHSRALFGR
jgi:hypothetical protein